MKDNEILELAARAVGPKVVRKVECSGGFELVELSSGLSWNPIEDDGAALRLAVLMELDVKCAYVVSVEYGLSVGIPAGVEKYAATRRAIVRAAAEIGKSMQP